MRIHKQFLKFILLVALPFLCVTFFPNTGEAAYIQEQKLTASDGITGDYFGAKTAISPDGTRAAVGAYAVGGNTGAVYIYSRSGTTWTQEQKLTASDGAAGDYFGYGVSFSSDGSRLVVGALGDDSFQGSAYVFSRSGTTWTQEQKLTASDGIAGDSFSTGVSMSPDGLRVAAGANAASGGIGATYVFSRSGTTWTQEQKLAPSDGEAGDGFGSALSFTSDSSRLANSSSTADGNQGAVYIFSRSGTVWTEEQKISASDPTALDYFGYSIAMSADGTRLVSGAAGWGPAGASNNQGAAYVFSRSGTTWTQEQRITSSDGVAGDFFGGSAHMDSDGSDLVIGAGSDNSNQGAAYVFSRSGTTWTESQKLTASDGVGSDFLGAVSMTEDGTRILTGAQGVTGGKGAAYVFSPGDVTDPTVSLFSPVDEETISSLEASLVITFDEAVNVGTGNITIYNSSNNSVFEAIDVTSLQVTGGGTNTITINPIGTFDGGETYYVQIANTAFADASANAYAGISNNTTWNFSVSRPSSSSSSGSRRSPSPVVSSPLPAPSLAICPPGALYDSQTGTNCNTVSLPTTSQAQYNFGSISVKSGTKGEECKAWQIFLNEKMDAKLEVDGWCGKLTMIAAKAWQASVGLVADGILGPLSRAKALAQ